MSWYLVTAIVKISLSSWTLVAVATFAVVSVNNAPYPFCPITYIPVVFPLLSLFVETYVIPAAATTCFTFVIGVFSESFICVISNLALVSPKPNWPYPLYPVIHAVPSSFITAVWYSPADTSLTPVKSFTPSSLNIFCGKALLVLFPKPNWPSEL